MSETQAARAGMSEALGLLLLALTYALLGVALLLAVSDEGGAARVVLTGAAALAIGAGVVAPRALMRLHDRRRGAHGTAAAFATLVCAALLLAVALPALVSPGDELGALWLGLQLLAATSAGFGVVAALAFAAGGYRRAIARLAALGLVLGGVAAAVFFVATFDLGADAGLAAVSGAVAVSTLGLGLCAAAAAAARQA